MSDKERPHVDQKTKNPESFARPETPTPEHHEERKVHPESYDLTEARIAEIHESLKAAPAGGDSLPTPPEAKASRTATASEHVRAVGYELIIEPLLEKVRELIASHIPEYSTDIDIGCGPGALALQLARDKNCTVYGIDLDAIKIERAKKRKAKANLSKVEFICADATNLSWIPDQSFENATMSLFIHSLPENIRHQVIKEATRIAKRLVIADYIAKQPISIPGVAVRGIERIAGGEHFESFNSYRASGGLNPLLQEAGIEIVNEQINSNGTIRVVVVEKRKKE